MRSREEKPSWTSQPPRYAPDHIAAFTIAVVAIVAGIITGLDATLVKVNASGG